MIAAWTGQQIRDAERPFLEDGDGPALMGRAAHALALECVRVLRAGVGVMGARVVALVGTGNNGGDALWAAAHLRRRGTTVHVITTGDALHPQGGQAARAAGARFDSLNHLGVAEAAQLCREADLVLDAVLGTGARGGLRGEFQELVSDLLDLRASAPAGQGPTVVAVDVVSGVEADTAHAPGTVLNADHTVTFGGAKVAHVVPPGSQLSGHVTVVPIGIEDVLPAPQVVQIEPEDIQAFWPRPVAGDHKYTRGVLGVVAGSRQYPGAALLCTRSAVAAGVGMVRYLGDAETCTLVTLTSPEVVSSGDDPGDVHVQAWVAGPGAVDQEQSARIRAVLEQDEPAVLDAGAFEPVGQLLGDRSLGPRHILTPHAGELEQLLTWCQAWGRTESAPTRGQIEAAPLTWVREAARATGATVLLKGAVTVVAAPGAGPVFTVSHGSSWLSTAGSGDCLAGIVGTLLAHVQGRPEGFQAAVQAWVTASPLPDGARGQLLEQLQPENLWALVAAVGAGLHASASVVAGHGPQPCLPEHIRAVLTRDVTFPSA
ncbi:MULTISPECIES: NAD(P)H-hydrate epimerase [Kocuria]|uniref:Bifunctional NAD(P)H-hydrate repair enzyme n=1 Tax=Kocuria subflava TaxID=1736139 RepID=A0A846TRK2_9MICC|nr:MULTISPECIES: NAD(P)H-hydrate epimerase [Kocuria]NKE09570.1 NAD(P)H-hydrate epimerase [Kocuria subflava]